MQFISLLAITIVCTQYLSADTLSEELDFKPQTQELYEQQYKQMPLDQDMRFKEGKITQNGSSAEWKGKVGKVNMTINVDHASKPDWDAEWKKNGSRHKSKEPSNRESEDKRKGFDKDKEKEHGRGVRFSMDWSSRGASNGSSDEEE